MIIGHSSSAKKKTINIRDLFIEPNFNELEVVASDSKGEPKKLNHAQLENIRTTGEFQVNYPKIFIRGFRTQHLMIFSG